MFASCFFLSRTRVIMDPYSIAAKQVIKHAINGEPVHPSLIHGAIKHIDQEYGDGNGTLDFHDIDDIASNVVDKASDTISDIIDTAGDIIVSIFSIFS